jgi:hypothetical protein
LASPADANADEPFKSLDDLSMESPDGALASPALSSLSLAEALEEPPAQADLESPTLMHDQLMSSMRLTERFDGLWTGISRAVAAVDAARATRMKQTAGPGRRWRR